MPIPTYDELLTPALQAVHELGGSYSIREMSDHVAARLQLTEEEVNEVHKGNRTKLEYRLAWARTYLKNYGLLDNSTRGVWSLTSKGQETTSVDKEAVKRYVSGLFPRGDSGGEEVTSDDEQAADQQISWQDDLLQTLQGIPPEAFERLCQRGPARIRIHTGGGHRAKW